MYWGIEVNESSLEEARKNNIFDDIGVKILKEELDNIDRIEEIKFDLLFQGELEIDLGGVTCFVKEMVNPHRNDGTIVYVP